MVEGPIKATAGWLKVRRVLERGESLSRQMSSALKSGASVQTAVFRAIWPVGVAGVHRKKLFKDQSSQT
jgi:hypothetical protein